jgi:UMF1 family MFS transporter
MTVPRKHIWGWWSFDWANQPYNTLLLTFVFAPYFASAVAPDPVTGQALWGWMLAGSGLVIALAAPVMGAIADSSGNRRSWLLLWSALYALGAAALWLAARVTIWARYPAPAGRWAISAAWCLWLSCCCFWPRMTRA